ncbi:MAG: hypothetical protein HY692_04085 [Cyanobacteria bacterium NC_groundwater_1444_Ag_S-0.65um_54_12]|nr:hypothetical protein [Cyanobacteria bacterium NC_groundwater_1444_Ag_S-0.65um_54_12]
MSAPATRYPFARRWWLYQAERFPLGTHFIAIALFFACAYFGAQALATTGPLHLGSRGWVALGVTFLTMLLLRVCDEFKDFADDRINYPDRVVQRGIVTLSELKVLGVLIGIALIACNLTLGRESCMAYALVIGFVWLMRVEFFVGPWLKRHIFIYALTHQGIVPLLCLYLAVVALLSFKAVPQTFWLVILTSVGIGLCFELSRKFRAPEDELATLDTYTKSFGPRGAAISAFSCLVAAFIGGYWLSNLLDLAASVQGTLIFALACGAIGYVGYAALPTARRAKHVKNLASLAIVLSNFALVAGMLSVRNFIW